MIKTIISKVFGALPIWAWIGGVLLVGLVTVSWLLVEAQQKIGGQQRQVEQLQYAIDHWNTAWLEREEEIELAQQRMLKREALRERIEDQANDYRNQIANVPDKAGLLDRDLGDAFWLPIRESAKHDTASLPSGEQSATESNPYP